MRLSVFQNKCMPTLFILAGAMASGKTELALNFAQKKNCEILSCDASAFYRGMDIGTAKPTSEEQQTVRHWGIDIAEPNEPFSIKDFVTYAQKCASDITKRGKNVLAVGGSGLYLKSFLSPVTDDIHPSEALQKELAVLEANGGIEALRERLLECDPYAPRYVELKNPLNVRKALERCLTTGLPLSEVLKNFQQQPTPYASLPKVTICLCRPLEILKLRIRLRVHKMLQNGLIDEVRRLKEEGKLLPNTPASAAIGYRETLNFLRQPTPLSELEREIVNDTYGLVKKQLTWFRHQMAFDEDWYG
jgi:tRNA dimethylallyltransferase